MNRANRGNLVKIAPFSGVGSSYYGIVMKTNGRIATVFLGNGLEVESDIDSLEVLPMGDGEEMTSPASFHEIMNPRL